ncbi:hypothetical protein BT69DRAFT_1299511 [Atractiella rhizophila]|nr:hypothetical protein BT69DRAFT_1302272 [Atractiella rhizophila]KAH8920345.1 hypothetical protein BT69DRAFT_1299511 [Atractiella rhizophila]
MPALGRRCAPPFATCALSRLFRFVESAIGIKADKGNIVINPNRTIANGPIANQYDLPAFIVPMKNAWNLQLPVGIGTLVCENPYFELTIQHVRHLTLFEPNT